MKMKIKIRFFGQLRELAKTETVEIQVKEKATVGDLAWILGERFPNLREHLKFVSCSVNNEYAPKETILEDGSEVALLPPISGG